MSIDEVMQFVERVSHYDPARPQDLSRLRAAIMLHVAEEVSKEREECAKVCDDIRAHRPTTGAGGLIAEECATAIRARAGKETT